MLGAVQSRLEGVATPGAAHGDPTRVPAHTVASYAEALLDEVLPFVLDDPVPTVPGPVFGITIGSKTRCLCPCIALDGALDCCSVLELDKRGVGPADDDSCVIVPLCLTFKQMAEISVTPQAPIPLQRTPRDSLATHAQPFVSMSFTSSRRGGSGARGKNLAVRWKKTMDLAIVNDMVRRVRARLLARYPVVAYTRDSRGRHGLSFESERETWALTPPSVLGDLTAKSGCFERRVTAHDMTSILQHKDEGQMTPLAMDACMLALRTSASHIQRLHGAWTGRVSVLPCALMHWLVYGGSDAPAPTLDTWETAGVAWSTDNMSEACALSARRFGTLEDWTAADMVIAPVLMEEHYVVGVITRRSTVCVIDPLSKNAWPGELKIRVVAAVACVRDAMAAAATDTAVATAPAGTYVPLGSQTDTTTCGVWAVMCAYACIAGQQPGVRWKPGRISRGTVDQQRAQLAASALSGRLLFRYKFPAQS